MRKRFQGWLTIVAVFAALLSGMAPARSAVLLMFESKTCEWCKKWNREVGVVYAKTAEARLAPLRRVDIFATRPADLRSIRGVIFTPTFVLWEQGREIGRITGYPGESNFWGMLGIILKKLDAKPAPVIN